MDDKRFPGKPAVQREIFPIASTNGKKSINFRLNIASFKHSMTLSPLPVRAVTRDARNFRVPTRCSSHVALRSNTAAT